jgi:hypothetical protein
MGVLQAAIKMSLGSWVDVATDIAPRVRAVSTFRTAALASA